MTEAGWPGPPQANHRQLPEVSGPEPYYNGPRPRICQPKETEAALKAALAQDNPESVPQVARRLGYVTSGPFFKPFAALCRAIYLKIARRKAARIRQMRRIAEAALQENPPPSLRSLAVRLGYNDKKVFARHFPDLGSKLQARRKALARNHAAQLREELKRFTRTEPAPSMAEVCRRLGLKHLTASRKFPKEYKLIVSRYQRRRRAVARLRV